MNTSYNRELLAYPASGDASLDLSLTDLLRQDPPPDYYGILDMLFTFVGMTLGVLLILFVDLSVAVPLCILIYALLVWGEVRHGIYSPVSISLLALYVVLYQLVLLESAWLPYFGLIVFAWLSLLSIVLMLLKKPMTIFYTKGIGLLWFHYLNSGIWLGAFVLSFIAGYLLMPSIWYLVVPFLICFCASAVTIYLNFFDTRFVTKRKTEFRIGNFTFRQLNLDTEEYSEYAAFYCGLLAHEYLQAPELYEPLRDRICFLDKVSMVKRAVFAAYHNGKIVGCLAQGIDAKGHTFEIEQMLGCSFNPIRKLGIVANLGRFGIAKEYREHTDVISGLAKGILEVSLERDVSFIVAEAVQGRSSFHTRLGFSHFLNRSDPCHKVTFPHIGILTLYFNNFAAQVYFREKKVESTFGFLNHMDALFAERWVKRMAVRHMFSRPEQCPWMHTIRSIRRILCIEMPAE